MISAISASTGGMIAAERRLDASASRVASLGSDTPAAKAVDPAAEIVAQATARLDFEANVSVLRVSTDMMKRVLDIRV